MIVVLMNVYGFGADMFTISRFKTSLSTAVIQASHNLLFSSLADALTLDFFFQQNYEHCSQSVAEVRMNVNK